MSPELKIKLQSTIEELMTKELSAIIEGSREEPIPRIIGIPYVAQEIVQWIDDVYADMLNSYRDRLEEVKKQELEKKGLIL